MDEKRRVKVSKFLSKHLRHEPERLGLQLAPGGWVAIDDVLTACVKNQLAVTRAELDEVVSTSDKQRFAIDPTGTLIRANQGHSVEVDLQLSPLTPPALLYHGTGQRNIEAIGRSGLLKMARHHVHLSADVDTARKVGSRHGIPVVFAVQAATMHQEGHLFFRSANGVWLVDQVPPIYLRLLENDAQQPGTP